MQIDLQERSLDCLLLNSIFPAHITLGMHICLVITKKILTFPPSHALYPLLGPPKPQGKDLFLAILV